MAKLSVNEDKAMTKATVAECGIEGTVGLQRVSGSVRSPVEVMMRPRHRDY